jgi:hypothetical protein
MSGNSKKISKLFNNFVGLLSFFFLSTSLSYAAPAFRIDVDVDDLAMDAIDRQIEMDNIIRNRVLNLLPRIYRRYCFLKVRPHAVTVSIGVMSVEWQLDRLCNQANQMNVTM